MRLLREEEISESAVRPETDLYYVAEKTETSRRRRPEKDERGDEAMHVGMDGDQTKAKLRIRKSAMPRGCGAATPGVSG